MSANIMLDKNFYSFREPAWHKLGFVSDVPMSAMEALIKLGGGYWVEKRPVTIQLNGQAQETGDFALVRSAIPDDPREYIFGYVGKGYNVIQPIRICELFDANVKTTVETLGFLGNGEKIFLTWILPQITVGKDEVATYGFVACGYDGKYGASLYNTFTRVVCQNTFNMAVDSAESGRNGGKIWSGKHNSHNIERDLGIWLEHVQDQALAKQNETLISLNKMATWDFEVEDQVQEILDVIYPDPNPIPVDWPVKLRSQKEEKYEQDLEKATRDRELVTRLFDGEGTAIDATAWGLFNAVTEYENWGRATRRPAEYSIMLGGRGLTMNKAMSAITDYMVKNP